MRKVVLLKIIGHGYGLMRVSSVTFEDLDLDDIVATIARSQECIEESIKFL